MLVFKVKTRKKYSEEKFAGFFIDQQTDVFINLLCMGDGISKSDLFRLLLEDWFKRTSHTEASLCKLVAKKAIEIFKYKNEYDTAISGVDFRRQLQLDLERKKIPDPLIETILKKFDGAIQQNK